MLGEIYDGFYFKIRHKNWFAKWYVLTLTILTLYSRHCHVTTEDDSNWVEFLLKAVKHNADNIRQLSQPAS